MLLPDKKLIRWLAATVVVACGGEQQQSTAQRADPNDFSVVPASAPKCATATPIVTNQAIGHVAIGVFLSQLREVCDSMRLGFAVRGNTRRPAIATSLGDIALVAELDDTLPNSRVFRIATRSTSARTADGVGPGVDVSTVAELWGRLELVVGRNEVMIRAPTRETILLIIEPPRDASGTAENFDRAIEARDWKLLPPGTKVAEMVLVGLT